jgi:hypothetical protein
VNITVAVGLITSGSTLAGGLIASMTALKVQKRQTARQDAFAVAERTERQIAQRRTVRREAYVQLLNKFDQVNDLVQECWKSTPPTEPDQPMDETLRAADRGMATFDNAMNTVQLEGPSILVEAAAWANRTFQDEIIHIAQLCIDNMGSKTIMHQIENNKYKGYSSTRLRIKSELIDAATVGLRQTDVES